MTMAQSTSDAGQSASAQGMTPAAPVPGVSRRRADAEQNRRAILQVAGEALLENATLSMSEIAKRAGVGNATLHRNFPSRESLILAVYAREVDELVAQADELLADHSAEAALGLWIQRLAQYGITKHGLALAMRTSTFSEDEHYARTYTAIAGALGRLLAAGEKEGYLAAGLNVDVVLLSLAGLWQLNPAGDWRSQAQALFGLVERGIRA